MPYQNKSTHARLLGGSGEATDEETMEILTGLKNKGINHRFGYGKM